MNLSDLYSRHRHSLIQFLRFGLVGGVGVLVNQLVLVVTNVVAREFFGKDGNDILVDLPFTDLNVRNYHVYVTLSFLVANLCNFLLNRHWTFRSRSHAPFWHEYWPFLLVGLVGQLIALLLVTAMQHPHSPILLPSEVFDGSTGLRNKLYWANLIAIICVMPVNFIVNKLWTFGAVRRSHKAEVVGVG